MTSDCDSQYVVKGIQSWIAGWKRKGWRKADGQPVHQCRTLAGPGRRTAPAQGGGQWVKGHAGHAENERVDKLAFAAAQQVSK